jgi:hypothetical protein
VNARSLQEDLLSIPGVEGAEVEGSSDRPAGLRIRIAEGADQRAVGGAIRRVLTSHGLGTDTRLPGESNADASPPQIAPVTAIGSPDDDAAEPGSATESEVVDQASPVAIADVEPSAVIDLTDDEELDDRARPDELEDEGTTVQGDGSGTGGDTTAQVARPLVEGDASEGPTAAMTAATEPISGQRTGADPHVTEGVARLSSVAVEEGRTGIVVTVSASDGSSVRQAAASTEGGVEAAVVRATAQLALPESPTATVVEIEDRRVEGVDIVMIVLDVNGRMAAGSAVVGAGRAFALARATWSALSM